jgi:hypothetical protein
MVQHEASCTLRREVCGWCSASFPFAVAFAHKLTCARRPAFRCSNVVSCDAAFGSKAEQLKHASVCIHRVVVCPYKHSLGCSFSCEEQHMAAHSADAALHLTLALDNQKRDCTAIMEEAEATGNFANVSVIPRLVGLGGSLGFADSFKTHIITECAKITSPDQEMVGNTTVTDLIAAHGKYATIVRQNFAGDALFGQALKDAFAELVNCKKIEMADLISTHCHQILKKDSVSLRSLSLPLSSLHNSRGHSPDHCAIAVAIVRSQFEFVRQRNATQSFCRRNAIVLQTQRNRSANATQSLRYRCGIDVILLRYRCGIAVKSHRSRCGIVEI